eukprot:18901-Heterococcus_DN1.PRE.1
MQDSTMSLAELAQLSQAMRSVLALLTAHRTAKLAQQLRHRNCHSRNLNTLPALTRSTVLHILRRGAMSVLLSARAKLPAAARASAKLKALSSFASKKSSSSSKKQRSHRAGTAAGGGSSSSSTGG